MKLYDLPQRQQKRPKIYGLEPDGYKDGVVEFDHMDGAYSYCVAYRSDGTKIGVVHLSASTPLVRHKDGYRLADGDAEARL